MVTNIFADRIKKKLEGDINELEIALDHANKANSEAQKSIKRYQVRDNFKQMSFRRERNLFATCYFTLINVCCKYKVYVIYDIMIPQLLISLWVKFFNPFPSLDI